MSQYLTIETQFVSVPHLVRALADLGFDDVEVCDQPQPLRGWLGDRRDQRAEVIIRREHLPPGSNDIGFVRNPNGTLDAFISDFNRKDFGPEWLQQLAQRYAYHVAKDTLARQNFDIVTEEVRPDRTIHITVRRMG